MACIDTYVAQCLRSARLYSETHEAEACRAIRLESIAMAEFLLVTQKPNLRFDAAARLIFNRRALKSAKFIFNIATAKYKSGQNATTAEGRRHAANNDGLMSRHFISMIFITSRSSILRGHLSPRRSA